MLGSKSITIIMMLGGNLFTEWLTTHGSTATNEYAGMSNERIPTIDPSPSKVFYVVVKIVGVTQCLTIQFGMTV